MKQALSQIEGLNLSKIPKVRSQRLPKISPQEHLGFAPQNARKNRQKGDNSSKSSILVHERGLEPPRPEGHYST